ncbi:MAG: glutathione S-transferase [Gammaproteobacteria bacterium]|nr:glutathione S-transferase [Gammaproteobacteria bacterium]
MSNIRLTYFDFDGGRGEPIRLALSIAGIEFEDRRITFKDFPSLLSTFPLGCIPILEMDGETWTQCNALLRYFGKKAGLYPEDPWQAYLCDEILDIMEDVSDAIGKTFGLEGEALKQGREAVAAGMFSKALSLLDKRLQAAGGEYFADKQLTIADLKVFEWARMLGAGFLDHVPTDLVQQVAPAINEHMQRIADEPGVKAYYEKRA